MVLGLGVAKVRARRTADAELAKSGVTVVHGKGGNKSGQQVSLRTARFLKTITFPFSIHTCNGTVDAQPGDLLVSNEHGCFVVKFPQMKKLRLTYCAVCCAVFLVGCAAHKPVHNQAASGFWRGGCVGAIDVRIDKDGYQHFICTDKYGHEWEVNIRRKP